MPIQHVKSITIADGTNTDIVLPSDWNSVHEYTLQEAVSLSGNTAGVMANISSGTFYLAGGNNVTLSQGGNSVTISGKNGLLAGIDTVGNTDGTDGQVAGNIIFRGGNNVTLSQSINGQSATVTISGPNMFQAGAIDSGNSSGDTGLVSNILGFVGGNNITLSQNTGISGATIIISGRNIPDPVYLIGNTDGNFAGNTDNIGVGNVLLAGGNNITVSQDANNFTFIGPNTHNPYTFYAGASGGNQAGDVAVVGGQLLFEGGNNITLSQSRDGASATINISGPNMFSAGVSNIGNTAGDTGVVSNRMVLAGGNNITLSQATGAGGVTVTISGGAGGGVNIVGDMAGNFAGATADASTGTILLAGGNNIFVSQSDNNFTFFGPNMFSAGVSNVGNTVGDTTVVSSQMVLAGGNNITLSQAINASGITVIISGPNTSDGLVHRLNTNGNTAGAMADISTGTMHLAGGNNITLSQNGNSVTISGANAGAGVPVSFYENMAGVSLNTMTLHISSLSHAVRFSLPYDVSASYIRIPMLMTTGSTSVGSNNGSTTCSAAIYSTWNAVVYSFGTGASSKSLVSVASGSVGWTFMHSLSANASGSVYTVSQFLTGNVEGNTTTASSSYGASAAAYNYSSNFFSAYTGAKMFDINFNNSLSAGAYWLIFGYRTSTASNGTLISAATACNVRYSNHYGATQLNNAIFGIMGSTNSTSGGYMGAGSFTTNNTITTSILPLSAISSSASHMRPYFQMHRYA